MKGNRKKRTGANAQPHDVFFRSVMKDVRVARDLIRVCLPDDLLAVTDLESLEWQKRDYTNTVRTESEIDVLYRTKISGMEAFLSSAP